MAEREPVAGKRGHEEAVAKYEQELAGYLQERIKPGLNRGAIPLLARSIAKEIAHREHPNGTSEDAVVEDAEADDELEEDDEERAEIEARRIDYEADMHEFQAELGDDWILRFSVHGDEAWLTAEKEDGSQRVEAPSASVLLEVVELLNERGGRS
jgi:hypothetical protein